MRQWLVFAPLRRPDNLQVVGISVVGHVRGVNEEHALRVAKTKGFIAPIIGEKHENDCRGKNERSREFIS